MLFALLALQAAAATADYPAPLAPAAEGKWQCYGPNDATKTCASMAAYKANGDGTFTNTALVLMSKSPVVTLQTATPVTIRNGAVCGAIRPQDIAGATLNVDGQVVPADKAAPILTRVATALTNIMNHQICTTYVPNGATLTATATVDGKPQPSQDQAVKWVSDADGYKVAP